MNPRIPLHTRVQFRFYSHDRFGLVAGEVGQLHDPVIAFRMIVDQSPRLVRLRMRGNVTKLGRGDLKIALIDRKYYGLASEIFLAEVNAITSSIETAEALKECTRLTAIEVPDEQWKYIAPMKGWDHGKRHRRLSHEEVNGRPHEDDSGVDFTVLTEYEYDTELGPVKSSSRQIYRREAFYEKELTRLGRDLDLLRGRLVRFSR